MSIYSIANILYICRMFTRTIYQLITFLKYKRTCTISFSRNLSEILFTLYHLLQPLKEIQSFVFPLIQIGPKWFNFYKTLSRYLKLYVLFILDCSDFILLLEKTQLITETFRFCLFSIEADVNSSLISTLTIFTLLQTSCLIKL